MTKQMIRMDRNGSGLQYLKLKDYFIDKIQSDTLCVIRSMKQQNNNFDDNKHEEDNNCPQKMILKER